MIVGRFVFDGGWKDSEGIKFRIYMLVELSLHDERAASKLDRGRAVDCEQAEADNYVW